MSLKKTVTLILSFSFLFLWCPALDAQTSGENTITYKSPSKKFVDITIQAHKGLPRFGYIYYERGITVPINPKGHNELLNMKYLSEAYADMDKNSITKQERNEIAEKKKENSLITQNQLLRLAGHICSEAVLQQYFCPDLDTKPCTFTDGYGYGQRRSLNYWGGSRNNEFKQMRGYTSFVKENLEDLQKWSTTFFEGDIEIGYLVSRALVTGPYDFKKKGYWLHGVISSSDNGSSPIQYLKFVPLTEDERKLQQHQLLFSITADKARKLSLGKRSTIFTVAKIKIYPDKKTPRNSARVLFSCELENPIIEIYKDQALTEKIGEISVESLISK